jgi:antitoxin component of RelBE/YafQ-DinJ toxin-antitoxin module
MAKKAAPSLKAKTDETTKDNLTKVLKKLGDDVDVGFLSAIEALSAKQQIPLLAHRIYEIIERPAVPVASAA